MFKFAIAWAFLSSLVLSPYKHLYQWLFKDAAVSGISAYQMTIIAGLVNYWIPALLIYLMLLITQVERHLKTTRVLSTLVSVSNWVLCIYVGLRVWTTTIEGGGASFALASMGIFFIVPAYACLVVCSAWLVIRSSRGDEVPVPHNRTKESYRTRFWVGLIALLVPLFFFAWTYQSHAASFDKARSTVRAKETRFEELCKEAKIDIHRRVGPAKSVYFPVATNAFFSLFPVLEFAEEQSRYPREGEVPQFRRITKKPEAPARIQFSLDFNTQMVNEVLSEYQIDTKILESPEDTKLGIAVIETTIFDRRTNEVLAVFVEVSERKSVTTGQEKNCPVGFNAFTFKTEVPAYVLGLMDKSAEANFEKNLARWQQQVKSSSK